MQISTTKITTVKSGCRVKYAGCFFLARDYGATATFEVKEGYAVSLSYLVWAGFNFAVFVLGEVLGSIAFARGVFGSVAGFFSWDVSLASAAVFCGGLAAFYVVRITFACDSCSASFVDGYIGFV